MYVVQKREARVRAGVTSKHVMVDPAMSIVTLPRKNGPVELGISLVFAFR
jgi:hypothetical protein